jgi:hypothetical protein
MKVPDIAAALAALTPVQALDLLSSIEALQAKAEQARTLKAQAEAQRNEVLARCTCNCGEPAKFVRFAEWRQASLRPYVDLVRGTGGLEGMNCEFADAGPGDVELWVDVDMWVHCGERDCAAGWKRVPNGVRDAIKDWS